MQPGKAVKKFFRRANQNSPEPLFAFGLSLFLHILLVAGVNVFFDSREAVRHLRLQSVVFDLTPIDESRPMTKEQSPLVGRQAQSRASQAASSRANENERLQASTYSEAPAASNPASETEASTGTSSTAAAPFSLTAESARPVFNTANWVPKLIPRRLAMPASQRRAIVKKVTDLVGKTITTTKLDSSFVWKKNGQQFQFNLSHLPASSATGFDELFVGVTTVEGGDTLATQFRMRRTAFSHFAQFVDYWDPRVALHNDEFDGRFHSNSAMVISSSNGTQPQFRGKVTTAGYSIRRAEERSFLDDSKVFLAGLEEGAAEIPLPRIFMGIPRDTSRSAGRIKIFSEESWLTFLTDGSYVWHTASSPQQEQRAQLSEGNASVTGGRTAAFPRKGFSSADDSPGL